MSIWVPYFALMMISILFASRVIQEPVLCADDVREKRRSILYQYLIPVILLLVFVSFRNISSYAIDEYAYRNRFNHYTLLSFSDVVSMSEPIFETLVWLSTRIFHSTQGIFILVSSITAIFLIKIVKSYSEKFSYGIALIYSMGLIYSMLNGIQQYLAVVVFAYYVFFCENKFWKYLVLTVVCTFIHTSAIVLLPLYFICKERPDKTSTIVKTGVFLIGIYVAYRWIPFLSQYISFLEIYSNLTERNGINIITILIYFVPAFMVYRYIGLVEDNDKITIISSNLTVLNAGIYFVGLVDTYYGRLAMFTLPFVVIFLSRIVGYMEASHARTIILASVLLFSIVLFIQMRGTIYTFNFSF